MGLLGDDEVRVQVRTFVDSHGVEIFTREWMIEHPRAWVLISHGASEHLGRYDRFAHALNDAGFAAGALDHRGHGRTGSTTGAGVMGPGGGQAVLDDLHELRTAAQSTIGRDVPVFVFGHSMGSLIALAYLTRHGDGVAGSVLCGVPLDVDETATLASMLEAAAAGGLRDEPVGALNNNASSEPTRTPYDWLSRDADEVDRYIADPLCGDDNPLTYGYLIDLFEVVAPARDHMASIACPVFVIAGDQDPAAGMGVHAVTLTDALTSAGVKVDLTLYQGARHELLNETNRDQVTRDVIHWLQSHL